ncbi:unnamed protein product, partial [Ectocarpus sp. 12 AP-2014]
APDVGRELPRREDADAAGERAARGRVGRSLRGRSCRTDRPQRRRHPYGRAPNWKAERSPTEPPVCGRHAEGKGGPHRRRPRQHPEQGGTGEAHHPHGPQPPGRAPGHEGPRAHVQRARRGPLARTLPDVCLSYTQKNTFETGTELLAMTLAHVSWLEEDG